jgi:hypothetical protein
VKGNPNPVRGSDFTTQIWMREMLYTFRFNESFGYDILINIETSDMKTIYFAIAGLEGLAAAVCYFRFGNRSKGISTYENMKKRTAYGEKHIRGIIKKSRPPLNLI